MTPGSKAFFTTRKFRIFNRRHTVIATLAQHIDDIDRKAIDTIDKKDLRDVLSDYNKARTLGNRPVPELVV